MQSRKPIRVDGNGEFGEKYHAAIALLRDPNLKAVVFGPDTHHAEPFLSLFAKGRVSRSNGNLRPQDCLPAHASTHIYCRGNWSQQAAQKWGEKAIMAVGSKCDDVKNFLQNQLGTIHRPTALVWIRQSKYEPGRNSTGLSVAQLIEAVTREGFHPVLIGEKVAQHLAGHGNLIEFYKDKIFSSDNSICTQLLMFSTLVQDFDVRVSIGMKSGGMDGAGLFLGLRTISFAHCTSKSRVEQIAKTIESFSVLPLDESLGKVFHRHTETELQTLCKSLRLIPKS